ncbi:MAG: phosphotransacetylase family protein [Chloroflexota bacterium]
MAATLYVASLEANSGKTSMCLAIGLEFKERGLSVGYMKPLGTAPVEIGGVLSDQDCLFMANAMGLEEPLERICPLLLTADLMEEPVKGPVAGVREQILDAYRLMAKGRDVVIMEGKATLADGYALGVAVPYLASATNAKVLLVVRYKPGMDVDQILMAKDTLGDRLIGVILTRVPPEVRAYVQAQFPSFLARYGMTSYGVLPIDKVLTAITVRDLASVLGGEVLCCKDKLDELVENFTVGAMNVDSALRRFLRMPNKAVITGGDRADIQLAALQTSTKVLILTGNLQPDAVILGRAMEVGVPIIVVKCDTMTAVNQVDSALSRIRLPNQRQLSRLRQLVKKEVDLQGLYKQLGLK